MEKQKQEDNRTHIHVASLKFANEVQMLLMGFHITLCVKKAVFLSVMILHVSDNIHVTAGVS